MILNQLSLVFLTLQNIEARESIFRKLSDEIIDNGFFFLGGGVVKKLKLFSHW